MLKGDQALSGLIRGKIQREGPVSFAWFMEQALYHPEFGYYSSGKCQIGRRGDYFTNVSVGPLFGKLLAGQFAEMWETLGQPAVFAVVEQGAHHGDFARDVLMAARERTPEFFSAICYHVIEPSPVLQNWQAGRLGDFSDKVTWENSLDQMEPFCGVHFSNELLDALPVHLISSGSGSDQWQERCVGDTSGGFVFLARRIVDEKLLAHLPKIPTPSAQPFETEVNLAALDWIEGVARKLARGFVLTVDYGYPRDQFYAAERTSGTLQCYAGHRTSSSPLENIGHTDISAHVDWTSVVERAEQCGLTMIGFTDQHHFLTGLISRRQPEAAEGRALQTLLHPELLGTRFQFLALGKEVPANGLSGFAFARDARVALGL
jgi:SAM-dependent MidA family methyltransferase